MCGQIEDFLAKTGNQIIENKLAAFQNLPRRLCTNMSIHCSSLFQKQGSGRDHQWLDRRWGHGNGLQASGVKCMNTVEQLVHFLVTGILTDSSKARLY